MSSSSIQIFIMILLASVNVLLLFISQQHVVESQQVVSPWFNSAKADSFMNCLVQNIASSSVFSEKENQDLESIVEKVMTAISTFSTNSSLPQIQAINMGFASLLAQLVVSEDVGNARAVGLRTSTLVQSLQSCSQSVIGSFDTKFIEEMNDIISAFADEPPFDLGQMADRAASGGQASTSSSNIVDILSSSLSSSGAFQFLMAAGLPNPLVSAISLSAIQSALSSVGIPNVPTSSLNRLLEDAINSTGAGDSAKKYASSVANGLTQVLVSSGLLTAGNGYSFAKTLGSALNQSLTSAVQQYDIPISTRISASGSNSSAVVSSVLEGLSSAGVLSSSNALALANATSSALTSL